MGSYAHDDDGLGYSMRIYVGIVPVLAVTFFGRAPLVIAAIFAVSLLLMWLIGIIFGPHLVPKGDRSGLVMELPHHKPRAKNVLRGAPSNVGHVPPCI